MAVTSDQRIVLVAGDRLGRLAVDPVADFADGGQIAVRRQAHKLIGDRIQPLELLGLARRP